jgi:hypothetical protein
MTHETFYVHKDNLPLLERLSAGDWEPRTTLLSPFDNMICDRTRTERLFNFKFRLEIYVPKPKRKFGYFVMPILHGDRMIGRVDPMMIRSMNQLIINAVYAERDAPMDAETAREISGAVSEMGTFLGAEQIIYGRHIPEQWKSALH